MTTLQETILLAQKEFLLHEKPVVALTGNEFSEKEGMTLTQQVIAYYRSIGNKVISPIYGNVILYKKELQRYYKFSTKIEKNNIKKGRRL
jgi:hypothetical protein